MSEQQERVGLLCQMTLEQIRQLPPEKSVYVRFVVENASGIITHIRGYDTLVIEKQERKRKGPLIRAIRPASFPVEIDLREKYTERSSAVIWSTEEGTFYCNCGVLWILQVFTEEGEGETLSAVEAKHRSEFQRRQQEMEKEFNYAVEVIEVRDGTRKKGRTINDEETRNVRFRQREEQ